MANSKQAAKRDRQAKRRNEANKAQRSLLKTSVKKFLEIASSGNKESIKEAFTSIQKSLDQFAAKGIISKNTASRKKSRLNSAIRKAA